MDGKIFNSNGKQHVQALGLSLANFARRIACAIISIQEKLPHILRLPVEYLKNLAPDTTFKLHWQVFLRTFILVSAIAAIIIIVLNVYAPRRRSSTLVQADIHLPTHAEQLSKGRAPATTALLMQGDGDRCSYNRFREGIFSNAKLINLLSMARQNQSTNQDGKSSSDSISFNLGYWTEKENSDIRISYTRNCQE